MAGKRKAKAPKKAPVEAPKVEGRPRQLMPNYHKYSATLRMGTEAQKRDATEAAFLRVFGVHVPDAMPHAHAQVMAQYGLCKADSDDYNWECSEAFMRRYHAAMRLGDGLDEFNAITRVPLTTIARAEDPDLAEEVDMVAKKKSTGGKKVGGKGKKAPAKKAPAKKKVSKAKKLGATTRVCELLCERKHTDDEIVKTIRKEFPDRNERQVRLYLSCQRSDINSGRKARWTELAQANKKNPLVRLYRDAKGKLTKVKPAA